ncbi:unnamed protein product [Clonostachys solani]|uniref:Uncharacterized protein n=1 Tax=Clonostachys solani TaxID=160281 RepID=A0A9N9YQZ8_9HYPO|nr:unnamed protein product [Clonostachys solani]
MASGYPSSEEQAGSYLPDAFEPVEKHNMTPLEAGIIAGTVVAFTVLLFLIFYCQHMEQRRRAQRGRHDHHEQANENPANLEHEMQILGTDGNKHGEAEPLGKASWSLLRLIKKQ